MKKIILTIFLILGAVSFSTPNFVDVNKIQKNDYEISHDSKMTLLIEKTLKKENTVEDIYISYDFVEENENIPVAMNQKLKDTSPEGLSFTDFLETKRAIISKYTELNNTYVYTFISKKNKIKNCYVSVFYSTDKNISKSELEKVCNKFLDEAESYLR